MAALYTPLPGSLPTMETTVIATMAVQKLPIQFAAYQRYVLLDKTPISLSPWLSDDHFGAMIQKPVWRPFTSANHLLTQHKLPDRTPICST